MLLEPGDSIRYHSSYQEFRGLASIEQLTMVRGCHTTISGGEIFEFLARWIVRSLWGLGGVSHVQEFIYVRNQKSSNVATIFRHDSGDDRLRQ